MSEKRYIVLTLEPGTDTFTPQKGVPPGPHNLAGVKRTLAKLRTLGYIASEDDLGESDPCTLVEEIPDGFPVPAFVAL